MEKLIGYLRLMRPANIVTAIADILAGVAISGYFLKNEVSEFTLWPVGLLVISTIGLYGGGVVFNDVFDAELDRVERPERPIPSGVISKQRAALLGISLLVLGVLSAFFVREWSASDLSFIIALFTAAAALVYDKWGKHHPFLGPVNMGLCRGANLLLGISILPDALSAYWFLALVPVIYIAAITMISRGEVHGGSRTILYAAAFLYLIVLSALLYAAITKGSILLAAVFLLLFAVMIFRPLFHAIKQPVGKNIGKAVKAGVIALIVLNAAWAAAFGAPYLALLILLLLPLSLFLAKAFAVT